MTRRTAPPARPMAAVSAPIPTSPVVPVRLEQKPAPRRLLTTPFKQKKTHDISPDTLHSVSFASSNSARVFIIGGTTEGGSFKYIEDFKKAFPHSIQISSSKIFNSIVFSVNDILFIQHLVSDITCDMITHMYNKYKCRVIISIHDYYYFSKRDAFHNAYLSQGISISPVVSKMFSIAELILYPSQYIYNNFSKYFPTHNFIVCPHIDYTCMYSELAIPAIANKTINIGALSRWAACKGSEYISYLQNNVGMYKGFSIKFIIVEKTIPIYNDPDFFNIVTKYNLHCLLCLNKEAESYCYYLSKCIKSGLPILYNKIGAVGERMPTEPHYMHVFDREVAFNNDDKQLLRNKFNQMLDFIIANAKPMLAFVQDVRTTVPELYKKIFSERYIIDPLSVKNVVLLSSAIVVSNNPLSYTDIRSVCSPHIRFMQTVKNINIIRYKIPNVAIILVDPTDIPETLHNYLRSIVDIFEDCSEDATIADMTNTCLNKGSAECAQLVKGLDHIHKFPNATTIFKISGRYHLSKSFNISAFDTEKVCFKLVPPTSIFYEKLPACFTFLFSVPVKYVKQFKLALQNSIHKGISSLQSVETILPFEFDNAIVQKDTKLGVSGFVGPTNIFLDDIV